MMDDVYEQLANALNRLPNGFPRTPSNVELPLLRKIFSREEAHLASQLQGSMEPVETIARRIGLSIEMTEARLTEMVKRGLVWSSRKAGMPRFRLAPFVVGIYEAQLENMDHEFAHLVEAYFEAGGIAGIMKPRPAIHRVVPAQSAVKSEWILPYDDVKKVLLAAKSFQLRDCICRVQQDHIDRKCSFPVRTCLSFSSTQRPPGPNSISQEEALNFLDKAENIGLVHTVSNVMEGFGYICNCCGCCCGILRGITEFGIKASVAHANYYATINPDLCQGCGCCVERCQVHAVSQHNASAEVDEDHCIGCGLCVTGCSSGAAELQRKPDNEVVDPPTDFRAWEHKRLLNRNLDK
ncbi:MAG: 4Fe-4S binding protein [Candidatus Bathyarchaeota archaeon]|nr:MAG: 4Fe-4S binding protein [Candidatus Bathyarchaeota archaeon]